MSIKNFSYQNIDHAWQSHHGGEGFRDPFIDVTILWLSSHNWPSFGKQGSVTTIWGSVIPSRGLWPAKGLASHWKSPPPPSPELTLTDAGPTGPRGQRWATHSQKGAVWGGKGRAYELLGRSLQGGQQGSVRVSRLRVRWGRGAALSHHFYITFNIKVICNLTQIVSPNFCFKKIKA